MKVRGWLIVLGLPVLIWASAVVVALQWDLPSLVATHFGVNGVADGFSSLGVQTLVLSAVLLLTIGGSTVVVHSRSADGNRLGGTLGKFSPVATDRS